MKYKITIKMAEKFHILKNILIDQKDIFVKKGHEKMTVMFIPHNEKKIFNFQISKFIISFFVLLFIVILITSTYAHIQNAAVKREEQRLMSTYNDIRSQLIRFEKITNSVDSLMESIKPDIEELYTLSSGTNETPKLWTNDDYNKASLNELNKMKDELTNEISTIRKIENDLVSTTKTIKTIKNFVSTRNQVVIDTPSIVPSQGHITSLFGWRKSPFGFGRDYHSGIDIAAPPGTEIRATAPGVVQSTGWNGGYGLTVRINHKYGFETIYAHCSAIRVAQGAYVSKGEIIAYVGQTGNATGNHLHYEIRLGGAVINPYPYMSRSW